MTAIRKSVARHESYASIGAQVWRGACSIRFLDQLRIIEQDVLKSISRAKQPSSQSMKIVFSVLAGTLRPEPHEEESAKLVFDRILESLESVELDWVKANEP